MGVKERVKKELGYMKKGAKVLPKVVAKKGKEWLGDQIVAAKERAAEEKKIAKAVHAAETEAYKVERIQKARERGMARARKGGKGGSGIAEMLGFGSNVLAPEKRTVKEGKRLIGSNNLGLANIDIGGHIMGDLGKKSVKKKKKEKKLRLVLVDEE